MTRKTPEEIADLIRGRDGYEFSSSEKDLCLAVEMAYVEQPLNAFSRRDIAAMFLQGNIPYHHPGSSVSLKERVRGATELAYMWADALIASENE